MQETGGSRQCRQTSWQNEVLTTLSEMKAQMNGIEQRMTTMENMRGTERESREEDSDSVDDK